jgi:tetratricopeptide (TPR) repeat protein
MGRALARVGLLAAFVLTLTEAPAMDIRALWDFDDPARSEAVFREHLAHARGDDALSLQTQIARTYGLRSRFDDAHALLDRIEPELAAAGPEPKVRHLLERGRTWRSAKQLDRARPLFLQAVDQAIAAGLEDLAIDAMHMMALVEPAPADQMRWNRRALAAAQQATDPTPRNWDATLANNIGMTLHDEGRFEEALASFRSALAARERIGRPGGIRVAQWMIAWTLRSLARHEEALAILYRLEREGAAAAAPDGFVAEEIAENLLALRRAVEARPWFAKAHALLSQAASLDRPDDKRLARLLDLSR